MICIKDMDLYTGVPVPDKEKGYRTESRKCGTIKEGTVGDIIYAFIGDSFDDKDGLNVRFKIEVPEEHTKETKVEYISGKAKITMCTGPMLNPTNIFVSEEAFNKHMKWHKVLDS